jgi:hypothetical protein
MIRVAAFALAALLAWAAPGQAQVIQLGGSDAEIKAMLHAQGYDRIDIVERGLSGATYNACLGPDRMQFKVYWDGRISTPNRIGGCRVQIGPEQATRILEQRGYERISLEDRGGVWLAVACNRGNRVRVEVSPFGDIGPERVLGRCEAELEPVDLIAMLEAQGFDRIEFKTRQGPRLVALACQRNTQLELVVNRRGDILESRPVGQCERQVSAGELPALLEKKGYDRVVVIDPRLPRYKVEACRRLDRLELLVNRFGEVLNEVRIGACPPPATAEMIRAGLQAEGYRQIKVMDNGPTGFSATACRDNRRSELLLNRFGEVLKERDLGRCNALTVTEVLQGAADAGLDRAQVYVEGCRGGRRIRLLLNEFGEEVSRERIGPC